VEIKDWVINLVFMFRDVGLNLNSHNFACNKILLNNIGGDDDVSLEETISETRVTYLFFCNLL